MKHCTNKKLLSENEVDKIKFGKSISLATFDRKRKFTAQCNQIQCSSKNEGTYHEIRVFQNLALFNNNSFGNFFFLTKISGACSKF